MFRECACAVALAVLLVGCGGTETGGTTEGGVTGHALKMDVSLVAKDGQASFLTPSNTIVDHPVTDLVGKPYLIATFEAGFASGNDAPIEHVWGEMPEDLVVKFSSAATYEDGPYDIVFVCYTATEISPEIQQGPPNQAPAAKGGDIASFTLSTEEIHEGDPQNALGTLRLNVAGADASVSLENRTPMDPDDADQVFAAFTNTVLTIP